VFVLENASDGTLSDVRVEVQGLRPDGADEVCQEATFVQWAAGEGKTFKRCGEKTRVRIRAGERSATFVVAGSALFQRIGRREILLQGR
jgi:hypothetical protein